MGSTDTSWNMLGHHFVLFSSCFGPVDPSQTQDIEKRPILRTSHAHSGVAVIEPLLSDFMSKKCPHPPKHFFFIFDWHSYGILIISVSLSEVSFLPSHYSWDTPLCCLRKNRKNVLKKFFVLFLQMISNDKK